MSLNTILTFPTTPIPCMSEDAMVATYENQTYSKDLTK